jgi:hypothetical protein
VRPDRNEVDREVGRRAPVSEEVGDKYEIQTNCSRAVRTRRKELANGRGRKQSDFTEASCGTADVSCGENHGDRKPISPLRRAAFLTLTTSHYEFSGSGDSRP